ncbi:hypothetical protein MLD38_014192 [Melastoma candidum]|uniref:Uncharacterized protein n=1 Tax=Melastoma candidum TaxID=119954 RepID=A0ACB9RFP8_9MYRT|nr:hypothetical protein MLD38_014192 [Melastoma candidum]
MNADAQESSCPTLPERICLNFLRLVAVIEFLTVTFIDCFELRPRPRSRGSRELSYLARETSFTVDDVEVLYELFKKVSSSVIDDGLIHKEELQLAVLQAPAEENLLLDRVFDLFDENNDGVIEFEEFIHTLNVFHPYTPIEKKIDFAFRLYDLEQTGYIERDDVERLVITILMESEMKLPDELLEAIINKTFDDADLDRDGRISKQEWKAFVAKRPSLLRNMTLPFLRDLATLFPRCVLDAEVNGHLGNAVTSRSWR